MSDSVSWLGKGIKLEMELDQRWGAKLHGTSVHVDECSTLKDGLRAALLYNHLRIHVEGDSALVINCFKRRSHVP
ncbi:hypothetical protein ACLB2K_037900 [Fragaria x ananassa]